MLQSLSPLLKNSKFFLIKNYSYAIKKNFRSLSYRKPQNRIGVEITKNPPIFFIKYVCFQNICQNTETIFETIIFVAKIKNSFEFHIFFWTVMSFFFKFTTPYKFWNWAFQIITKKIIYITLNHIKVANIWHLTLGQILAHFY